MPRCTSVSKKSVKSLSKMMKTGRPIRLTDSSGNSSSSGKWKTLYTERRSRFDAEERKIVVYEEEKEENGDDGPISPTEACVAPIYYNSTLEIKPGK